MVKIGDGEWQNGKKIGHFDMQFIKYFEFI